MEKSIKVGIIDDNPSITGGLKYFFEENNLNCIFSANSKTSFLDKLDEHILDVVIVDVIMPDVVGLDLFETLLVKHPFLPVIVYSNIRNVQIINDLFRLKNVFGIVSKNEEMNVLHETILKVVNEKKRIFPDEYLNLNVDGISLKLSDREMEVLNLLSEGSSSKVISEKLNISENTVLFHRKKLFNVFNTSNVYHLIVEAKECGFLK